MTDDDHVYDLLWRECFDAPLPVLGGGEAVRQILTRHGISPSRITAELMRGRRRNSED